MRTIAKRLDALAALLVPQEAPQGPPIAWEMSGPHVQNWQITDVDRWPGYIVDLLRAGLLAWEVYHSPVAYGEKWGDQWWDGRAYCQSGPAWSGFVAEHVAALETVNDIFLRGMTDEEQARGPRCTADMVEFLEAMQNDNPKTT